MMVAGGFNATYAPLERSRTAFQRISAWPWRPGTFRGLLAAVFLPLLL